MESEMARSHLVSRSYGMLAYDEMLVYEGRKKLAFSFVHDKGGVTTLDIPLYKMQSHTWGFF